MKLAPDVESWLSLSLINGLGDESIRRLLVTFGSPSSIFAASTSALERVVRNKVVQNIKQGVDQEKLTTSLKWLEDPANSIITSGFNAYSIRLRLFIFHRFSSL